MRNNMPIGKILLIFSIFSWFIIANRCTTSTHLKKRHKNLAYLYNPEETFLHPQYLIYNDTEDSSRLYIKVLYQDLLIREMAAQPSYAFVSVEGYLYASLVSGGLLDSIKFKKRIFIDSLNYAVLSVKIKTPNLKKTYLKIKLTDIYSERSRDDYIEIDKTSMIHRQNFLIKDKQGNLIWNNVFKDYKSYTIEAPIFPNLYIHIQKLFNQIAFPPYSSLATPFIKYNADSTFLLRNKKISLNQEQMIFITHDTNRFKGIQYLVVDSLYPKPHTPTEMLQPVSYLLSKGEFLSLQNEKDPKYALDRFWLKIAGSKRHAVEMIQVFYRRVMLANKYFTSYKKGWQTDRGMIYIVFGEPTTVYKSATLERWIYGDANISTLVFDFSKNNDLSYMNDYELVRGKNYQASWSQAVSSWRGGKIFAIVR